MTDDRIARRRRAATAAQRGLIALGADSETKSMQTRRIDLDLVGASAAIHLALESHYLVAAKLTRPRCMPILFVK